MPRTLKKAKKASEKARDDSESVGTSSKSQKNVNKSSKNRTNSTRERERSSDEMTQTERTQKTKKAVSNNSDRKRDQILKIDRRSKSISKPKKAKGINRSSFCYTNFARETLQSNQGSSSGVDVTQVSRTIFAAKGGIEYASAPDQLSGIIKIKPGGEKSAKVSLTELQFVVMQGKVECIFGDLNEKYSVGSKVSIPKDTIYGLKNPGKVECLLQYQAF